MKNGLSTLWCVETLSTIYLETDFVWVVANVAHRAVSGMSNGNRQRWSCGCHHAPGLPCERPRGSATSSARDFPVHFRGFNWKLL